MEMDLKDYCLAKCVGKVAYKKRLSFTRKKKEIWRCGFVEKTTILFGSN
jgi:hypothetical protein